MGSPKALLEAGDTSFIEAVVRALREGGCEPIIVVTADEPEIVEAADATGARVIRNLDPGEGPITSLRLALAELGEEAEGLVYHPVDHPLVRSDTVGALLRQARERRTPLVVPVLEGERGHPTYFARELFEELLDPELEGGARTVVHRHLDRASLLRVDDPGIVADIDTPAAYREVFGLS